MSGSWWVVLALQSWDGLSVGPYRVGGIDGEGEPKRWIAVFDDREKAIAWAGGKPVVEVRIIE